MRIVVDSSALAAIFFREPERDVFISALLDSEPSISIVTLIEVYAVVHARLGVAALEQIERRLGDYRLQIEPVSASDLPALKRAMLDFGKGRRRPPAVLNFGDLFAYALAKRLGVPLLYKGDDFARTDVKSALS